MLAIAGSGGDLSPTRKAKGEEGGGIGAKGWGVLGGVPFSKKRI